MTKPITAAAVLMLQDEGKLSVDDPVEKYLPEFKSLKTADGKPARVTIRHLLTHTSGMGEISANEARGIKNLAGLIPLYVAKPVHSGAGHEVGLLPVGDQHGGADRRGRLGRAVRRVPRAAAVRPARNEGHDLLSHREAAPAACHVVSPDRSGRARSAAEFASCTASRRPAATASRRPTAASSPRRPITRASARWSSMAATLDGRRYLKPESVKLMTTIQTGDLKTGFTEGNGWGLGWCVVREPQGVTAMLSPGTFGHGGAYGTQAWIDPVKKRIYILMVQRANFPNSDASEVRRAFQEAASTAFDSSK